MGVNTDNPQGLLHVDAKGNTSGGLNIADDVVFTSEGRIGAGALTPQARLDIRGSIRIVDGTEEGGGKILTSDAGGAARWTSVAGSWYATLRGGSSLGATSGSSTQMWPPFVFTSPELSPPGVGAADHTAGVIQVPYTGMYRVTIYGMAHTSLSVSVFLAYMNLSVNNVSQFAPHLHAHKSLGTIDFGFMTLLSLNEGDEVALAPQRGATYCANRYTNTLLHIEFVK